MLNNTFIITIVKIKLANALTKTKKIVKIKLKKANTMLDMVMYVL